MLDGLADGEPPTALIDALTHLPQVRDWAWGDLVAHRRGPEGLPLGLRRPSGQQHTLRSNQVAPRFFRVWGMRVLAGDPLTGAQGDACVVLDAQAARLLGFASPAAAVGQWVRGGGRLMQAGSDAFRVAAVVDDLRFEAGQLPAMPKLFVLRDEAFGPWTLHRQRRRCAPRQRCWANPAAPQPRPPAAGGPGQPPARRRGAEKQRLTGLVARGRGAGPGRGGMARTP